MGLCQAGGKAGTPPHWGLSGQKPIAKPEGLTDISKRQTRKLPARCPWKPEHQELAEPTLQPVSTHLTKGHFQTGRTGSVAFMLVSRCLPSSQEGRRLSGKAAGTWGRQPPWPSADPEAQGTPSQQGRAALQHQLARAGRVACLPKDQFSTKKSQGTKETGKHVPFRGKKLRNQLGIVHPGQLSRTDRPAPEDTAGGPRAHGTPRGARELGGEEGPH